MTAPLYRDSKGRFVSLPPDARAKLEAMRIPTLHEEVHPLRTDALNRLALNAQIKLGKDLLRGEVTANQLCAHAGLPPIPYVDAIYPQRKGWIERALTWFTWNRSRA